MSEDREDNNVLEFVSPTPATETREVTVADLRQLGPGAYDAYFDGEKIVGLKQVAGRRKVAIVGFAETSKKEAPYEDESFEVWSLNQHMRHMPRASRWFEMHDDWLADQVEGTDYQAWLRGCPLPVYMTGVNPLQTEIPMAVDFPIDKALALVGLDYWQSSLAFMLALALLEDMEQIAIYGVDLIVGEEYDYQKANMEFVLGVARGLGYEVTRGPARGAPREIVIPENSALLRQTHRYGYEKRPSDQFVRILKDRHQWLTAKLDELKAGIYGIEGAINDTEQWLQYHSMHQRGATVIWKFCDQHFETLQAPKSALMQGKK